MTLVEVFTKALKQVICDHEFSGGNDYLYCDKCGLEYDYGKMEKPTTKQIVNLALEYGELWSCNTNINREYLK